MPKCASELKKLTIDCRKCR